jgi:GT2 family glycosyltransferase
MYICIPTYRELTKIISILESLQTSIFHDFIVVIVNANYRDETTEYINSNSSNYRFKITELEGHKKEYWSSTVNRGLEYIKTNSEQHDSVLLCNVDITFKSDTIDILYKKIKLYKFNAIIGAISIYNSRVVSSGVKVISWLFPFKNYHPLVNSKYLHILDHKLIEVDLLPCRCILIPFKCIQQNDLILDKFLPHYHADYEFTNRLKRSGYGLYFDSSAPIYVDMNNTGFTVFNHNFNFIFFIRNFFSIKNQSNPRYRINFVLNTFPKWAIPTALFSYLIKSLFEILYGVMKNILKK